MNLKSIKANLILKGSRAVLTLQKHSPEILMGVGVIGLIVGTVGVTKAVTKAEAIIDNTVARSEHIKTIKEHSSENEYSQAEYQKDIAIVYAQGAIGVAKTVIVPASLMVGSVLCIVGGHNILKRRNVALIAAYNVLAKGFQDYRSRVVEEQGEDKDFQYKHGIKKELVDATLVDPETGKKKKIKAEKTTFDPNTVSVYARYFDEANENWYHIPEQNLMFLLHKQNYLNDMLRSRGHVFLNEAYDELGFKRTDAGNVVGWVISKDGDNFVDFGIFTDEKGRTKNRAFVNNEVQHILLDFNVDGIILDLI